MSDSAPAAPAYARLPAARPPAAPQWLAALLHDLVASGRASAAAALVASPTRLLAAGCAGAAVRRGAAEPLFDLASLTKVWSASLALRLDALGLLPLGLEVGQAWPGCDRRLGGRTLEDLLRHRSGLAAWTPLYRRCRHRGSVARLLTSGRLLGARRGTYSDLGYVLWGLTAERLLERGLGELLDEHVARPLGLVRAPARGGGCFRVPCQLDNGREVELAARQGIRVARRPGPPAGRVQDGNTRFLGGLAAHAGLFASPRAVVELARAWLRPGRLWPPAAARAALCGPGRFGLGWRRPTLRGSAGPGLGERSFGQVGFTGGSLWVDPERHRILVLLAHRTRREAHLEAHRRRFHRRAPTG